MWTEAVRTQLSCVVKILIQQPLFLCLCKIKTTSNSVLLSHTNVFHFIIYTIGISGKPELTQFWATVHCILVGWIWLRPGPVLVYPDSSWLTTTAILMISQCVRRKAPNV